MAHMNSAEEELWRVLATLPNQMVDGRIWYRARDLLVSPSPLFALGLLLDLEDNAVGDAATGRLRDAVSGERSGVAPRPTTC